jgi:hypothetical protein
MYVKYLDNQPVPIVFEYRQLSEQQLEEVAFLVALF